MARPRELLHRRVLTLHLSLLPALLLSLAPRPFFPNSPRTPAVCSLLGVRHHPFPLGIWTAADPATLFPQDTGLVIPPPQNHPGFFQQVTVGPLTSSGQLPPTPHERLWHLGLCAVSSYCPALGHLFSLPFSRFMCHVLHRGREALSLTPAPLFSGASVCWHVLSPRTEPSRHTPVWATALQFQIVPCLQCPVTRMSVHASPHCWRCVLRTHSQRWGCRSQRKGICSLVRSLLTPPPPPCAAPACRRVRPTCPRSLWP